MCPTSSRKRIKLENPDVHVTEEDNGISESESDSSSDEDYEVYTCQTEIEFLRMRNIELSQENQLLLEGRELLDQNLLVLKLRLEILTLKYNKLDSQRKSLEAKINLVSAIIEKYKKVWRHDDVANSNV